MNNIILIGYTGCGKREVGNLLADKLQCKFIDLDEEIAKEKNQSLDELLQELGEDEFRKLESASLEKMMTKKNKVIATGDGIVLKKENIELMQRIGTIIFLNSSHEQLFKKLESQNQGIQDHEDKERIRSLLSTREPKYFDASNIIVQTKDKSIEDIVEEIVGLL